MGKGIPDAQREIPCWGFLLFLFLGSLGSQAPANPVVVVAAGSHMRATTLCSQSRINCHCVNFSLFICPLLGPKWRCSCQKQSRVRSLSPSSLIRGLKRGTLGNSKYQGDHGEGRTWESDLIKYHEILGSPLSCTCKDLILIA